MKKLLKRSFSLILAFVLLLGAAVPGITSQANALSYSGSASFRSGKYYTALRNVNLTGNQRLDIVNIAKSQVGYQEGNYGQLSGTVRGSGNYTEYGNWYGLQDMWCAMFVSWCASVAGVSTSIVPKHCFTPSGLSWFMGRGQAHSRYSVAIGQYTPQPGDIIYFKSPRNNNSTNHVGIVTSYSNGTVYTVEGNTSSATVSTNGGAVAAKSYSIYNTYIVYICSPQYKNTSSTTTSSTLSIDSFAKSAVFSAQYYSSKYPDLKGGYGTNETLLYNHFINNGIKEHRQASPIFDANYYLNNNSDLKKAYGTNTQKAFEHFIKYGIKEVRNTAPYVNLGESFYAEISNVAGTNVSISSSTGNVLTYHDTSSDAQTWQFIRLSDGSYKIVNKKTGTCLDVYNGKNTSGANVQIYTDNGNDAQRWYIHEVSSGKYVLRPRCASGCVLDVQGGGNKDNTNVQIHSYNGSNAQIFRINKVNISETTTTPPSESTTTPSEPTTTTPSESTTTTPTTSTSTDLTALAKAAVFNKTFYSNKYTDLKDGYGTSEKLLYNHFINYGIKEWRQASAIFDASYYLNNNADLKAGYGDNTQLAYEHFIKYGIKEVRYTAPAADLGTDFYAEIKNVAGTNVSISTSTGNVLTYQDTSSDAQTWQFIRLSDGSYKIINKKTGKCLEVAEYKYTAGINVQTGVYTGSDTQRWFLHTVSSGEYVLRPRCSSACVLEVYGGGNSDNTNIQTNSYNNSDAQIFKIEKVDSKKAADLGTEFTANIGYYAEMNLATIAPNVIIYTPNGSETQRWRFVRQNDGSYKIINAMLGTLMTLKDGETANRTEVILDEDTGSTSQCWFIYEAEGGYVLVPADAPQMAMNVFSGSQTPKTMVEIYALNYSEEQIFTITEI